MVTPASVFMSVLAGQADAILHSSLGVPLARLEQNSALVNVLRATRVRAVSCGGCGLLVPQGPSSVWVIARTGVPSAVVQVSRHQLCWGGAEPMEAKSAKR